MRQTNTDVIGHTDRKSNGAKLVNSVATAFAVGAAATALCVSILPERRASAEEATGRITATATEGRQPVSARLTSTDGSDIEVYVINRTRNSSGGYVYRDPLPVFEIHGPSTVTVEFYLLASSGRLGSANVTLDVEYSLTDSRGASTPYTHDGNTHLSNLTYSGASGSEIGTPIQITVDVPEGDHRFSITGPTGFVRVLSITPRPTPVAPDAGVQAPDAEIGTPDADLDTETESEPSTPPPRAPTPRRPLVEAIGDYEPLTSVGPSDNDGLMADARADVAVWQGIWGMHQLVVLTGIEFETHRLELNTPEARVALQEYAGLVRLGLAYSYGAHTLEALVIPGYQGMQTNLRLTDGRGLDVFESSGQVSGLAGYRFDPYLNIFVRGGMDPFHPLSAGIEGRSPSWARTGRGAEQVVEVYPTLAVNVDLLRTLNPVETADQLGVAELGELLTRLRIRALIPTYPIPLGQLGALTISASGEVVIDFTGGGQETSAYLGGEARLRLRGFELAAEVLSSLDGDVRFMIIARYLRAQREAAQRADE